MFARDGGDTGSEDEVEESTLTVPALLDEDEYPESDISEADISAGNDESEEESDYDDEEDDEGDGEGVNSGSEEYEGTGDEDEDAGSSEQQQEEGEEDGDSDDAFSQSDAEREDDKSGNYYNPTAGEDIYGRPIDDTGGAASGGKYIPPARRAAMAAGTVSEKLRESVVDEVDKEL